MTKKLLKTLASAIAVLLITFACRTNEEITYQQKVKISAFERFESAIENAKYYRTISAVKTSYAYPFSELILFYFSKNPRYKAEFLEKFGNIDLRAASQNIGDEEKFIFFPIIENNKVSNILACFVNNDRSFVKFRIMQECTSRNQIISDFQNYYNFSKYTPNRNARDGEIKEGQIEEVVLTGYIRYHFDSLPYFIFDTDAASPNYGSLMDGGIDIYGGGGGGGDYSDQNNDPCAKLKSNLTDTKFNEKANSLNNPNVLNYAHEMGFASSYAPSGTNLGTQYQPMDNKIGSHSVRLPDNDRVFGFMHTHNNEDGVIKIFSPADVMTFLTSCVVNADQTGNISDAYAMVITSEGSYMLQYTGTTANFGNLTSSLSNWNSQYRENLQKVMNEDGSFTQSNVENAFLQFLKNNVNINGLELYKVDGTTSNKLSLNTNNTTNSTPCP